MEVTRTAVIAPVVAIALALAPGCFAFTTKSEGKTLRNDVDEIDRRLSANENTLQGKIAELEEVLGKATKLLQRNSADLGADVKALVEENAQLTGLVMDAKRVVGELRNEMQELQARYEAQLQEIDARVERLEKKAQEPPPKTAAETFSDGKRALDAKQYQQARIEFAAFVRKWPGHESADDAMYYWGAGHYLDGNYEKAIAVYQKVFVDYKDSKWADEALYKAAESAEKLKWCTDALAYYAVLQQNYPRSSLKKKAAARIKALKKDRKNKSKCQS
jgi:TolA-binding protein